MQQITTIAQLRKEAIDDYLKFKSMEIPDKTARTRSLLMRNICDTLKIELAELQIVNQHGRSVMIEGSATLKPAKK